jgi:hypothetical protein
VDILTPFRNAFKKVVRTIKRQDRDEYELVDYWKRVFEVDKQIKSEWNARFDLWNAIYEGDYEFSNLKKQVPGKVRTAIKFAKMIIESQIDLNIPEPDFKAVAPDDEANIKLLNAHVKYVVRTDNAPLERINLENERAVKKYGICFYKVHWNNQIKRAGYVGDIEISAPHVKDIIPNSGATSIDDLEHYHHVVNRTEKYILRKWKHITREALEQYASLSSEYDEIGGAQEIPIKSGDRHDSESGLRRYTVIETTYKDVDGDICKLWWSGDLMIKHVEKFYYRRGPDGSAIDQESVGAAKIAYYIPKCWDLVPQYFAPRDKCFWGSSLVDDIKDLLESVKKVVHIEEEKILKGTTKILVNDKNLQVKLADPLSEIILTDDAASAREIQMGNDNRRGIEWIDKCVDWMQLITGATNAALGQEMPGVTSGKQALLYITQAQQRVDKSTAYKAAAFKHLYRVVADFILAFADFDRPFRLLGDDGQETYGVFNRLNMLRDYNGNLIYPDWDIEIGSESGFLKSKPQIFEMLVMLANSGKFEPSPSNLVLLRALDKLGVPHLKEAISNMETQIEQQDIGGDQFGIQEAVSQVGGGGAVPGFEQEIGLAGGGY